MSRDKVFEVKEGFEPVVVKRPPVVTIEAAETAEAGIVVVGELANEAAVSTC